MVCLPFALCNLTLGIFRYDHSLLLCPHWGYFSKPHKPKVYRKGLILRGGFSDLVWSLSKKILDLKDQKKPYLREVLVFCRIGCKYYVSYVLEVLLEYHFHVGKEWHLFCIENKRVWNSKTCVFQTEKAASTHNTGSHCFPSTYLWVLWGWFFMGWFCRPLPGWFCNHWLHRIFASKMVVWKNRYTLPETNILLMEEILHQLIGSFIPLFPEFYIPGGAGFLPSAVGALFSVISFLWCMDPGPSN